MSASRLSSFCPCMFVFFNDTATTEIYTLSLHDALPICERQGERDGVLFYVRRQTGFGNCNEDRKSTRLNSSHSSISYAVFCLKNKNNGAILDVTRNTWLILAPWSVTDFCS